MKSSETPNRPSLATDLDCVGCFACVSRCPVKAISVEQHNDGHDYICIDESKCIGCLKCERVCRDIHKKNGSNDLNLSELFGGWSTDDIQRSNGTSGGVFAAFAEYIIKSGGVVVGAYFDGRACKHRIIRTFEEISELQGSKYTPSSLLGLYEEIEKELKNRTVLFTGLGCQCAAVLAFFKDSKWKDNLITVDMVCGGVPSKLLIEKYFEANPRVKRIVSFRTKDKYELTVEAEDGICVDHNRPLPLYGFSCGMTNRLSCYECQYAYAHRATDITIGDLWDYNTLPEEHSKGVSMIVVHSERGKKLLFDSEIETKQIDWRGPLLHNQRLVIGKQRMLRYRKKLGTAFDAWAYDDICSTYCLRNERATMMVFKIGRKLLLKIDDKRNKKKVDRILIKATD